MTHRTFISIILATALAVTGMASVPAQADGRDAAKFVAGAAALAIIGSAIADDRRDRRNKKFIVNRNRTLSNGHQYEHNRRFNGPNHIERNHGNGLGIAKRKKNLRANRRALPVGCRRHFRTTRGPVFAFGRNCLLNNYSHFNSLPQSCAVRARGVNNNRLSLFGAGCLKRHGYFAS